MGVFIYIYFATCTSQTPKPSDITSVKAIDEYHGQLIEDPYRNLENLQDTTVINWIKRQSKYASDILKNINGRQQLIDKMQSYDIQKEYSKGYMRTTTSGMYFYTKTMAKEPIGKLYYQNQYGGEEKLLFDPANYKDGSYRINNLKPDWEGEKIAISMAKKGEEASEIFVMEVTTKKILPGIIKKAFPGLADIQWLSDNSGFLYLYSPIIDPTDKEYWMNTQTVLYTIGSDPDQLRDIFSRKNNPELKLLPEDFPIVNNYRPMDGYLFGVIGGSSVYKDMYYIKESELKSENPQWRLLYKQSDKVKKFIVDNDDRLVFLSGQNATNYQICRTLMSNPDFTTPEIVVPEKGDRSITRFEITRDGLFYTTKKNGIKDKLYYFDGISDKEIILPKQAESIFIGSKGPQYSLLRLIIGGNITPSSNYFYDISSNKFTPEILNPIIDYPDFQDLLVEHIEVPSHDGIMVPVSIIRRNDSKKDGSNPTLFYGYGSYGGVARPSFNCKQPPLKTEALIFRLTPKG